MDRKLSPTIKAETVSGGKRVGVRSFASAVRKIPAEKGAAEFFDASEGVELIVFIEHGEKRQ